MGAADQPTRTSCSPAETIRAANTVISAPGGSDIHSIENAPSERGFRVPWRQPSQALETAVSA